ncbi:hypothetical protein BKA69DRAFT_1165319, partial [Paraphysoderma sedebokerense]
MDSSPQTNKWKEVVIIYSADGTLIGEIKYITKKIFGVAKCAACDITHGWNVNGKTEFKACAARIGIPVILLHKNEISEEHRYASNEKYPCVLARDSPSEQLQLILTSAELETCKGDAKIFESKLRQNLGLTVNNDLDAPSTNT